jgi:hypothetical protein
MWGGGVDDVAQMRFDFQTFDWEQFIAVAQGICAPDDLASADGTLAAADVADFLACQDEFTRIVVPFSSYPRGASGDPLQLARPGDGYRDLAGLCHGVLSHSVEGS